VWISQNTEFTDFELDELHWYTNSRKDYENGINAYIMTMISRIPRQITGFAVDRSVTAEALQRVADSTPAAQKYHTDGLFAYMSVLFVGKHIRNSWDKSDTHNIESTNSDLRHYIPGLARKSRCFFRTLETMKAVLAVFIDAYNKFGEAKLKHQIPVKHKSPNPSEHLHKFRDVPFSILDYL